MRFSEKNVLVTGATSGIGREAAKLSAHPTEFALQWSPTHQPQPAWELDHQTGPPHVDDV